MSPNQKRRLVITNCDGLQNQKRRLVIGLPRLEFSYQEHCDEQAQDPTRREEAPLVPQLSPKTPLHAPKLTCIKSLAESADLTSIPSNYTYSTNPIEPAASDPEEPLPRPATAPETWVFSSRLELGLGLRAK
ncbi:hypothetical protein F0562_003995 [Nyssa sinensis]|uniref:Uncharacterized protein n=1 Tax=Nyssa sinensis TaxID=561372 RepID=A0A5J5BY47_9ASTE|nr:hypothetical protein F0562_003995 [Nyssa sinensis]